MVDLNKCITVSQLMYVLHGTVKVEFADFFTCEEVYNPADDRKVVTISAQNTDKLFVFVV